MGTILCAAPPDGDQAASDKKDRAKYFQQNHGRNVMGKLSAYHADHEQRTAEEANYALHPSTFHQAEHNERHEANGARQQGNKLHVLTCHAYCSFRARTTAPRMATRMRTD